ncbi:MAG: hypothetical protein ACT4RN_11895 [Pseudonocardia sp.]
MAPDATPRSAARCRCGHGRDAHEHFRRGSDCALCGCPRYRSRYRSRGALRRLLARAAAAVRAR